MFKVFNFFSSQNQQQFQNEFIFFLSFFQFFSGFMHLQGSDQLILLSLRLTICISIPKYSIINMRIYMKIQNSRAVVILSSELMKRSSYYASKKRIFPSLRTTLLSHKCETDKEKVMISGKKQSIMKNGSDMQIIFQNS